MEIIKSDFTLNREAEEKGHSVSMGGCVERIRTELNNQLSDYFKKQLPKFNGIYDEDEGEDILDSINTYLEDNNIQKHKLEFPYTSGSDIYLIPVTDNLSFKVLIVDEYYGNGDYEKFVAIERFIINDNTTVADVDLMIEVFDKYDIK